MKINLEVNNVSQSPEEDEFFAQVAQKTLTDLGYEFLNNKEINISLALVFAAEIKKINREYRQYDSVTDVLSFAEYQSLDDIKNFAKNNSEIFLGELILCYDDIKEYARTENLNFKKELSKVVSHGILHLMGFSHGEEMFSLQEKISDTFIK